MQGLHSVSLAEITNWTSGYINLPLKSNMDGFYCHFYEWMLCQVPLARSEGNLLELMEGVCERMEDYGEVTDPSTDRKSYVRIKPRSGEAMDLSEATLDSRVTASLKFAVSGHFQQDSRKPSANKRCQPNTVSFPLLQCETIVEHHEDEIIEFFAHETDNVKDKLCSKRTGTV